MPGELPLQLMVVELPDEKSGSHFINRLYFPSYCSFHLELTICVILTHVKVKAICIHYPRNQAQELSFAITRTAFDQYCLYLATKTTCS